MSTLSAQLAYLFYLGDQATSQSVKEWSAEYLIKEVIGWAQHVDILWPTLSDNDKQAVLSQAKHIYIKETRRYGQNVILQQLLSNSWDSCLSAILLHVVANKDTPEKVFVEAIQRCAKGMDNRLQTKESDSSVNICVEAGALVSRFLQPAGYCERIIKINNALLSTLAAQPLEAGANDLLVRYVSKKENESCISVGLALVSLCSDALVSFDAIKGIVSMMFYAQEAKRPFFRNCLLFFCIYNTLSKEEPCLTKRYVSVQQMVCEFFYASLDAKTQTTRSLELLISYDSYSLAQLCKLDNDGKFVHAYSSQLLNINEKSQMAMLSDYMNWRIRDAEVWGSDTLILGLVEKWQHLLTLNSQLNSIAECLQNDSLRFDRLKAGLERLADNPGVIAIVDFWNAFYEQFSSK